MRRCLHEPFFFTDPCGLPKVVGLCRMAIRRYYFNAATGTCTQFTYGGCGGNANRFATKKECQERCEGIILRELLKADKTLIHVVYTLCTLGNALQLSQAHNGICPDNIGGTSSFRSSILFVISFLDSDTDTDEDEDRNEQI